MPNRHELCPGDTIRILCVPEFDLAERERGLAKEDPEAGWTADTIERLIRSGPVVTIDRIDEYGQPWFDFDLEASDGAVERHTMAVMEDESWEKS